MRPAISHTLYAIGHAIWWTFDRRWIGGMHWPIYRTYQAVMSLSAKIQGHGPGPWEPVVTEAQDR